MATICARFIARACAAVVALLLIADAMPASAEGPHFKVDPFWPKPLPNNWIIGQVGGMSVDAQDNIWVFQRPRSLTHDEKGAALKPPRSKCCVPAPSVLVFNQSGDVVKAWGGPGDNRATTGRRRSTAILVDNKGFVWLSGNGKDDSMVLKFTTDGKFVKQIGKRGPLTVEHRSDAVRPGRPRFAFDAAANEIYAADGYGNHRVAVLDADTGEIKRIWGAYGKPPTDDKLAELQSGLAAIRQSGALRRARPRTAWSMSATASTTASRCFTRTALTCGSSCSTPRRRARARPGVSRSRRSTRRRTISC